MKKTILLLLIISFASIYIYGQEKERENEFITLTYKIVNLEEINTNLQIDNYEKMNSIFIQADTNFIGLGREIFDRNSNPGIFIWHLKTLFFYDINFWLKQINVLINEDFAVYEFETCSSEKLDKKYYKGYVEFINQNGDWVINNKKINRTKNICLNPMYQH